ncbi:hypothetical protein TU69_02540 [Bacillus cereus]|nr:hypothetical protein IC5_01575 [Bacillus cereus AND1407]KAB7633679.1 hypothetical protein GBN96_22590 [Bacillus sp. B4-WWTP-NA-D-NA-NA]KFL81891.1 hypothetical protein DJ51_1041 [Bacillus cereus]MDR4139926.1 hypothetical protein [Bacillus paranthracis]TDT84163.1 hypothetical protein DEU41_1629 [Bacillus sp. AG1163]
MKLKIKTPNGFKSDIYISPEFISAIGMLVTSLHLAGIICFLLFLFIMFVCFVQKKKHLYERFFLILYSNVFLIIL